MRKLIHCFLLFQLEELERIEHERQLEEEEQRRQEELAELERQRSQASLLSMTSNDADLSDGPVNSTPRKSDDSGIGYTDTAALLKEKLQQLSNNEDGQLEGIGKKRHAPPPPSQSSYTQDNVSLPPKRQTSDDGKSTTTGSYESEGSNDQWYVIFLLQ